MVDGVASQATEMGLEVRLADFRFVAAPAASKDDGRLGATVALDQLVACVGVFGARAVASFAAAVRRILAFQSLHMGRLGK